MHMVWVISYSSFLKKSKQEKLQNLNQQLKEIQKEHKKEIKLDKKKVIKKVQSQIDDTYSEEVKKKLVFFF